MGERILFHGSTAPAFPAFSLEKAGRQPGKSAIGALGIWLSDRQELAEPFAGDNGVVYRVGMQDPKVLRLPYSHIHRWSQAAAALPLGQDPVAIYERMRQLLVARGIALVEFQEADGSIPYAVAPDPGQLRMIARRHTLIDLADLPKRAEAMDEEEFRGLHRLNQKRVVWQLEKIKLRGPTMEIRPGLSVSSALNVIDEWRRDLNARIDRFKPISEMRRSETVEKLRALCAEPAALEEPDF